MTASPTRTLPMIDPSTRPFWDAAGQRRLVVQRNVRTGALQWPPRPKLLPEWAEEPDWVEVSGRARVWSYSVIHRSSHPAPPTPYVLAVVELEEGLFMTTNLVGIDLDALRVGMPVAVTFEPLDEGLLLPLFGPAR